MRGTQKDKLIQLFRLLLDMFEKEEFISYEVVDCLTEFPGGAKGRSAMCNKLEVVFRAKETI